MAQISGGNWESVFNTPPQTQFYEGI